MGNSKEKETLRMTNIAKMIPDDESSIEDSRFSGKYEEEEEEIEIFDDIKSVPEPEGKVIIYGFLQKKSKYIHLWKTRFCILTNHYLFAFTGIENDADCTMALLLSNVIEVREMTDKNSKKKIVALKCKKLDYIFRTDNDLIFNKWMDKLKEAVKNSTKNELKPVL